MRKLLLFVFVLANVLCGQTPPSGYTSTIHLSKWNDGATPGATAINNNWTIVDSAAKAINDTANAVKTDFYLEHNYLGNHKSGVITWDNLYSVDKNAYIVQMTGNQTIGGYKTFSYGISFWGGANLLLPVNAGNNTWKNLSQVGNDSSSLVIYNYGTALKDTIASQRWVRNNPSTSSVTTNTSQTITGAKQFSGGIEVGSRLKLTSATVNCNTEDVCDLTYSYPLTFLSNSLALPVTVELITGGAVGDVITLIASDSYGYTFTDGAYFKLGATRVLGNNDVLMLINNGTGWTELSYSDN